MADHRIGQRPKSVDEEWVGPHGGRENVTAETDRALIVRAVHELLVMQREMSDRFGKIFVDIGQIHSRLAAVERHNRGSQNDLEALAKVAKDSAVEITTVHDLRMLLKSTKRKAWAAAGGIFVAIVTAYLCMKLGVKLP